MDVQEDTRFEEAADCQASVWYAEDAGEYAGEEAKRCRHLVGQLANEYDIPKTKVSKLVSRRAMEIYDE